MQGGGLRAQLLRGGIGSIGIKVVSVGLSLAVGVVLARVLGVGGFGLYSYVFALVSLLAVPAKFGLPGLLVRETAQADAKEQWGRMRGIWRWTNLGTVGLSLFVAIVGGLLAWVFAEHFTALQLTTFAWGLVFIPLLAFGSLRSAVLLGLRKVVQGQLPETIIRPALLICFLIGFGFFAADQLSADQAMALHVLAATVAFGIAAWMVGRAQPDAIKQTATKSEYQTREWLAAVLPFAFIGGMQLINTKIDVIMLGALGATHDVGLYQVAARGSELVLLGLVAIRQIIQPYFARLYANGEMKKLQRLATAVARVTFALALPATIIFLAFGAQLIGLVFGDEFRGAYVALSILCLGKLIGSAFGPLGALLTMTGYERDIAKVATASAGCVLVLDFALIPLYGLTGAAIGTAATLVGRRVIVWALVRHRLGIDSSPFGIFGAIT